MGKCEKEEEKKNVNLNPSAHKDEKKKCFRLGEA
jgi:hypothetical protein